MITFYIGYHTDTTPMGKDESVFPGLDIDEREALSRLRVMSCFFRHNWQKLDLIKDCCECLNQGNHDEESVL
jgi:hypothetical protein